MQNAKKTLGLKSARKDAPEWPDSVLSAALMMLGSPEDDLQAFFDRTIS